MALRSTSGEAIFSSQPGAQTASFNTADIGVAAYDAINVDVNLSAAGGTSPSCTIAYQRKGADGNYYPVWTSSAQTANGNVSITIGRGFSYLSGTNVPAGIGSTGRLAFTISGTSPTFTPSISVTSA